MARATNIINLRLYDDVYADAQLIAKHMDRSLPDAMRRIIKAAAQEIKDKTNDK